MNFIRSVGAKTLGFIQSLGSITLFFLQILAKSGTAFTRPRLSIRQVYFAGVLSVLIVAVSGLFVGMVLGLQGYTQLAKFNPPIFWVIWLPLPCYVNWVPYWRPFCLPAAQAVP